MIAHRDGAGLSTTPDSHSAKEEISVVLEDNGMLEWAPSPAPVTSYGAELEAHEVRTGQEECEEAFS